jgi:hypothetical protein
MGVCTQGDPCITPCHNVLFPETVFAFFFSVFFLSYSKMGGAQFVSQHEKAENTPKFYNSEASKIVTDMVPRGGRGKQD